jgi:beta-lactamase domain protein|nr:MAG TPA: YycJ-like MBL-fold protein [Caudoviricetes sp.]
MEIKTLASGSTGNAYLVGDGTTTLLLECGISVRELMRRSRFTLSRVDACLITHEHGDHARAVHDVMARGIPVYCSEGTAAKLGISGAAGCNSKIWHIHRFDIGTIAVLPFSMYHDAAEPLGWLLESVHTGERLVFLTDTSRAEYVFPPLDHILIECNHMGAESMMDTNAYQAQRVIDNHLSLQECIAFLTHQDLSCVQDIRLLHISRRHGDPDAMRRAVAAATGKRIIIAEEEI